MVHWCREPSQWRASCKWSWINSNSDNNGPWISILDCDIGVFCCNGGRRTIEDENFWWIRTSPETQLIPLLVRGPSKFIFSEESGRSLPRTSLNIRDLFRLRHKYHSKIVRLMRYAIGMDDSVNYHWITSRHYFYPQFFSQVDPTAVLQFLIDHEGVPYIETSARTGENVGEVSLIFDLLSLIFDLYLGIVYTRDLCHCCSLWTYRKRTLLFRNFFFKRWINCSCSRPLPIFPSRVRSMRWRNTLGTERGLLVRILPFLPFYPFFYLC